MGAHRLHPMLLFLARVNLRAAQSCRELENLVLCGWMHAEVIKTTSNYVLAAGKIQMTAAGD